MSQLNWTEILNIGCPQVDDQHKNLIGLSNELIVSMAKGEGQNVLEQLFDTLFDYTQTHFADEERFMKEIDYPRLEAHKIAHRELADKVLAFKTRLLSKAYVVPDEALDFVTDWIVDHIIKEDSQIGSFVRQKDSQTVNHADTP